MAGDGKVERGGVLRNHYGEVIFSFAKDIGTCSVVQAELWAIYFGLKVSWDRGFKSLHVESDSQVAINLLKKGCNPCHRSASLVRNIMSFTHFGGSYSWSHVLREANQAADALAKDGLSLEGQSRIFDICPDFLYLLLVWEMLLLASFPVIFSCFVVEA